MRTGNKFVYLLYWILNLQVRSLLQHHWIPINVPFAIDLNEAVCLQYNTVFYD